MNASASVLPPPSGTLLMMEARAMPELAAFVGMLPILHFAPRGDGHPVLVLPGLLARDETMIPMREFLAGRGYAVSGWGQGRNLGLREGVEERLFESLQKLNDEHGRKVSLVGWSLGGLYARFLASKMPERVRSVITLGSPFAGDPRSTNAWRIYEMASGQSPEDVGSEYAEILSATPTVPTTAIYSRTDGVCAWRGCVEKPSAHSESIEVESSHCGMSHHPAVVYAVAERLSQPEGQWQPFHRRGWRGFVYPNPER